MENLFYFLLIIAWLAYSVYKQNVKRKRLLEAKKAAQPSSFQPDVVKPFVADKVDEVEKPGKPDFARTLEDIILGDIPILEDIPASEAQSLETISEEASSDENRYQKYSSDETIMKYSLESLQSEDIRPAIKSAMEPEETEVIEHEITGIANDETWFDLRKAVIYAEVLNRKYVY